MAYDKDKLGNVRINTDLNTLKAAAERIKSDPKQVEQFKSDPSAFLSRFGIELDQDTLSRVQSHLSARQTAAAAGAAQAGLIHVDI
jgi:hypothetical protein